jgi:ubiquinone/menaquinone biosynthesis C-methylase UbiE
MEEALDVLDLQPGHSLVSIGVGGGLWEVMLSFYVPKLHIHLNDTNPQLLNYEELTKTIKYFEQKFGKICTAEFQIHIGTDTDLAINNFMADRLLIFNSLHEMPQPAIILEQCRRLLKPQGKLIVEEQLATIPGQLHQGCGKALFTKTELLSLLASSSFRLLEQKNNYFGLICV